MLFPTLRCCILYLILWNRILAENIIGTIEADAFTGLVALEYL